jgi:hypothetical protein
MKRRLRDLALRAPLVTLAQEQSVSKRYSKDARRADLLDIVLTIVLEDVLDRLGRRHQVRDEESRLKPYDSAEFSPPGEESQDVLARFSLKAKRR